MSVNETNRNPKASYDELEAKYVLQVPVYASKADIPDDLPAPSLVYIEGDSLYLEDGT